MFYSRKGLLEWLICGAKCDLERISLEGESNDNKIKKEELQREIEKMSNELKELESKSQIFI